MALCNPVDKSTCVIETKKLRSETAPNTRDMVTVKSGSKLLEAMVIVTDGKWSSPFSIFFPDYC